MGTLRETGLLLAVLLSAAASLSPNRQSVYHVEGENYTFRLDGDFCELYRSSPGGELLLGNISNHPQLPGNSLPPTAGLRDRLTVVRSYVTIRSLRHSDSAVYSWKCWNAGKVNFLSKVSISVCVMELDSQIKSKLLGGNAELQCDHGKASQGNRIRWSCDQYYPTRSTLLLDTNVSMMPVPEELRGRMQVFDSGSSLCLTGITEKDWGTYYCQVLDGEKCLTLRKINLNLNFLAFLHVVGERAVLPCSGSHMEWKTPLGERLLPKKHNGNTKKMHVVNDINSSDYSLVFPSVAVSDSGIYSCFKSGNYLAYTAHILMVCPLQHINVTFSLGDSVVLPCGTNLTESNNIRWYHRSGQQGVTILDPKDPFLPVPEELRGRVNVSLPDSSLIISKLSLEDSGEYWCTVLDRKEKCISGSQVNLIYVAQEDPFGIDSTFYAVWASLMGCGLLGMICAVITVRLKTRKRDPASQNPLRSTAETPGHQSSEGEQMKQSQRVWIQQSTAPRR